MSFTGFRSAFLVLSLVFIVVDVISGSPIRSDHNVVRTCEWSSANAACDRTFGQDDTLSGPDNGDGGVPAAADCPSTGTISSRRRGDTTMAGEPFSEDYASAISYRNHGHDGQLGWTKLLLVFLIMLSVMAVQLIVYREAMISSYLTRGLHILQHGNRNVKAFAARV